MKYNLHKPCEECPFLVGARFEEDRLEEFASGEFPCHMQSEIDDKGHFVPRDNGKTNHCAGALIYLEKRNAPHQMMRICERLSVYDRSKLDMAANVR